MQFDHPRLLVANVGASVSFYREMMGMRVTFDDGGNYAALEGANRVSIHLFRRDLMAEVVGRGAMPLPADTQDPITLIFEADDLDATAQRLRDQGVPLVTEPQAREEWGIRTFHLRDPDGYLVEVNEPLSRD